MRCASFAVANATSNHPSRRFQGLKKGLTASKRELVIREPQAKPTIFSERKATRLITYLRRTLTLFLARTLLRSSPRKRSRLKSRRERPEKRTTLPSSSKTRSTMAATCLMQRKDAAWTCPVSSAVTRRTPMRVNGIAVHPRSRTKLATASSIQAISRLSDIVPMYS